MTVWCNQKTEEVIMCAVDSFDLDCISRQDGQLYTMELYKRISEKMGIPAEDIEERFTTLMDENLAWNALHEYYSDMLTPEGLADPNHEDWPMYIRFFPHGERFAKEQFEFADLLRPLVHRLYDNLSQ